MNDNNFKILGINNLKTNEVLRPSMTYWQNSKRKFKNSKIAIVSSILLISIIIFILIAPHFAKYSIEKVHVMDQNLKPNLRYIFGTDQYGRDEFIRVIIGARTSFLIGSVVASINVIVGIIYGTICGYYGGLVDDIINRIIEIIGSIPNVLIVLMIILFLGPGILSMIVAMSIAGWCNIARIIRGEVLKLKQQEFILAADALGASSSRIISRHLITNVISIVIVAFTLEVPNVMLNEAILCYMGVGVTPPNITLGTMMCEAQEYLFIYPYQVFIPAAFLSLSMVCFNMLGDSLSSALDPKMD